ncbi:MAG TPA: molybdopterin-dependent oxidoreductase, partial [Anaeromyxobacteraceae bacterium]
MTWELTRRDLLKAGFTTAVVTAAGPLEALAAEGPAGWTWDKAPCRFCGVGCGVLIASERGRLVAVKGDPDSPVNRGLLCVKGYALPQIPYGADRLTTPLLRMKDGKFDKKGDFVPVSWEQAFDVMEKEWRRAHAQLGPTGVGIMGSGQYLIQEGYAAVKLAKVGWRSNNLDPNARHCMASAVTGFMQTFGIDEPSGCYDDIELTDTVVMWGSNMAEMHPMLWARIVDKRLREPSYRVVNLTTYSNRSSDNADCEIVFKPNTDLAIWNYIAREIVRRDAVDHAFVKDHCVFATGPADIGFGMRDGDAFAFAAEKDTQARERVVVLTREEAVGRGLDPGVRHERKQEAASKAAAHWLISFDQFKKGLEPYTLDFVARLSKGDPHESLEAYQTKL